MSIDRSKVNAVVAQDPAVSIDYAKKVIAYIRGLQPAQITDTQVTSKRGSGLAFFRNYTVVNLPTGTSKADFEDYFKMSTPTTGSPAGEGRWIDLSKLPKDRLYLNDEGRPEGANRQAGALIAIKNAQGEQVRGIVNFNIPTHVTPANLAEYVQENPYLWVYILPGGYIRPIINRQLEPNPELAFMVNETMVDASGGCKATPSPDIDDVDISAEEISSVLEFKNAQKKLEEKERLLQQSFVIGGATEKLSLMDKMIEESKKLGGANAFFELMSNPATAGAAKMMVAAVKAGRPVDATIKAHVEAYIASTAAAEAAEATGTV